MPDHIPQPEKPGPREAEPNQPGQPEKPVRSSLGRAALRAARKALHETKTTAGRAVRGAVNNISPGLQRSPEERTDPAIAQFIERTNLARLIDKIIAALQTHDDQTGARRVIYLQDDTITESVASSPYCQRLLNKTFKKAKVHRQLPKEQRPERASSQIIVEHGLGYHEMTRDTRTPTSPDEVPVGYLTIYI